MPRKPSDLTVTDQFCGAGGSSIGAARVGARLRMALNHWKLAIETHNTNFPEADHDCTDISACDPRRYPSTDILITSPECTNHSLAKGKRRKGLGQFDAFTPAPIDPAEERSRATMWDVPRFAEFHRYNLVIVENVVDARHWEPYPAWLKAMHLLGYEHREVFLNSMFCWPTPQSRDRMYVVFWRKGNRAPDLEFRPPAWCPSCERNVEAVQAWKNPTRRWGRYRQQYVYRCPACAGEVLPYYYAALNAIDWSIQAERIGDRKRPLRPRTIARIRYGLEKYGRQPLQIITNMTTDGGRVRPLDEPLHTQTGSALAALASPFLINTRNGSRLECRVRGCDEPLGTQTATGHDFGVAIPHAFLVETVFSHDDNRRPIALEDPMPSQTARQSKGLVVPPAFVMTYRNYEGAGYPVASLVDPLHTLVTNAQDRLVIAPAVQNVSGPRAAIAYLQPYLVQFNRTGHGAGAAEAMPTITTRDRCGLVEPTEELRVEDCYFRMLKSPEIGRGMAFPEDYVVLGNESQKVRQYGNAVTPPAMEWLVGRGVESLEGVAA